MKKFFAFFIRQSVAIVLVVLFVLAFGVYSTIKMPINLLPDINVPMVCVQIIYPGANAESVEKDVTEGVEEGLSSIGGITEVDSYSYDNLSAVVLSFDYGTDTGEKKSDINSKLSALNLPDGVTTDVYDIDLNAEALATLSVTSKNEDGTSDLAKAYEGAKALSSKLAAIDGVESVEIKGGADEVWTIKPFGGLELLAPLIVQTYSYGALDIPLGNLTEEGSTVQIRNNSDITSEEDIKNSPVTLPAELCAIFKGVRDRIAQNTFLTAFGYDINDPEKAKEVASGDVIGLNVFDTIKSSIKKTLGTDFSDELIKFIILTPFESTPAKTQEVGGQTIVIEEEKAKPKTVAVSDIATVEKERKYSSYVYFGDGSTPQVIDGTIVEVYKSNGANSSAVVDKVKKVYGDYLAGDGEGKVAISLLDDQSQFISDSISNVLISMLIGGALAVVVIFIFLKKIKTSLIIAVTMPLSVLAAIICLSLMGITLNMVSLGGLAVGIGMLVDNSIVVIESISKHRDMDKSAFEAAVDGTTEVGGALFGSTLTTVCVFIPIIFSGGLTGEIFTDLSFAVIFSLSLSLIIAVTVIPALYSMLTRGKRMLKGGRLADGLDGRTAGENVAEEDAVKAAGDVSAVESVNESVAGDVEKTADVAQGEVAQESADVAKDGKADEGDDAARGADGKKERRATGSKGFKGWLKGLKEPKIMQKITAFYGKILPMALNKKIVPILSAIIIFGASIGLLFLTGTEFLPSIDKGQIEIDMSYGSNSDLEEISRDVSAFAAKIEKNIENIDYISVSIGKNGLLALTDTGIITLQLTTNRGTDKVVERIRKLNEDDGEKSAKRSLTVREVDGVVASLMSGSDDLSVTILGKDGDTLKEIAGKIEQKLPEQGFTDIKNSSTDKSVQYDVKFNRRLLEEKGLDYQTLVMTLRIGMSGYDACTATIDGGDCTLNVRFKDGAIQSIDDLKNFVVGYAADGAGSAKAIKLSDDSLPEDERIALITQKTVDACIRRTDGKEMVSISATLPGADTGTAGKKLKKAAAEVLAAPEYEGYEFEQSGISSYLNDAFGGLAIALVISFFLLFAVMAVQFGSAVKSLIIMASIPFSFTGGFLALVITGTSLNVVSFIGLIMLMGVVVNNAIVMLEKIKQLHEAGASHYDAVIDACKVRLRPIFMTTLTTILALIPLAIGIGQGSELMQPLGIVVIGGLFVGTLVTLVLIPAVYCAVHGISKKTPEGRKGKE